MTDIPKSFDEITNAYRTQCKMSGMNWAIVFRRIFEWPSAHINLKAECLLWIEWFHRLCFSDCIDSHCLIGHTVIERVFPFFTTFRFVPETLDIASGGSIQKVYHVGIRCISGVGRYQRLLFFLERPHSFWTIGYFESMALEDDSRIIQGQEL